VVEALCAYARQLHLHQIYAIIATTNEPALQLFSHAGFQASAKLQDWLRTDDGFVDAVVWQQLLSSTPATA
jgi:diamine N-acetyltransferase